MGLRTSRRSTTAVERKAIADKLLADAEEMVRAQERLRDSIRAAREQLAIEADREERGEYGKGLDANGVNGHNGD